MATSDLSKQTGKLGVAPTTYVCPRLAGSVAAGVVFVGVLVLMLIPRTDHGDPVIDEASLEYSPEPEVALSPPSPRIDLPDSAAPSSPSLPNIVEPKPAPPEEPAPVELPVEVAPAPKEEPEPEPAKVQAPIERENVIKVLQGEFARIFRGDEFVLRGTAEGSVNVKLAAVSAPAGGLGRNRAAGAIRDLLSGPVTVQCIEQVKDKSWIGWVYSDGVELNEAMIAQGFAWYDPRTIKSATLKQLQEQARAEGLGIWKGGKAEPIYPEELQRIGTEEEAQDTTEDAAAADTETNDVSSEVDSKSPADSEPEAKVTATEVPPKPAETPSTDPPANPVVVDQSSPEKLIFSFMTALQQNDLDTARGLLSVRPFGRARSFREGRLSPSGTADLQAAFDGAKILTIRPLSRRVNVVLETSTGKKMQVLVEQVGSNWVIHSWDVPR